MVMTKTQGWFRAGHKKACQPASKRLASYGIGIPFCQKKKKKKKKKKIKWLHTNTGIGAAKEKIKFAER
jgi:hypothetical protein